MTAHLRGSAANLRHERLNGSVGERLRLPGTIKEKESKLTAGFVMFYNFIRKHTGLGGKAPAEAAGFVIDAPNPWDALIHNAFWEVKIE